MLRLKKARKSTRSNKKYAVDWKKAPDIEKRVKLLLKDIGPGSYNSQRIYCFRSKNSSTRALARIWGFSRIWQLALNQKPAYIIEVISERFDRLSQNEKDKILLHEIAHIPNNFSGSLLPHIRKGKRRFSDKIDRLIAKTIKKSII